MSNGMQRITSFGIQEDSSKISSFQIQDLTILEEVLRMMLEIINSCLTHRLAHNPNLIYTLLYKKDIFQPFRMHSAFQDVVQNIDSVSRSSDTWLKKKKKKLNIRNQDENSKLGK